MKRLLLMLLFIPSLAFAAGPYDGIWQTSQGDFQSIHESEDATMIMMEFDPSDLNIIALIGSRSGSVADLSLALGSGYIRINLVFDTLTTGRVLILECTNIFGNPCFNPTLLPIQASTMNKVF
jgi:hypothetical protein